MRAFLHSLKSLLMSLTLLASALSLSSCGGSGNMFGNGSGAPTSATAANQVAGIDIANGNYSAAISVLTPFCPNNNCQNSDLANTLANAYMAMGNSSASASVTGTTSVTGASGGGRHGLTNPLERPEPCERRSQHLHHSNHPGHFPGRTLHQQQYLHPNLSRQPGHGHRDSGEYPLYRIDLRRRQLPRLLHHHRGRHALYSGRGPIQYRGDLSRWLLQGVPFIGRGDFRMHRSWLLKYFHELSLRIFTWQHWTNPRQSLRFGIKCNNYDQ